MQMHPNSRCLLNHTVNLFIDDGFVSRAKKEYGQRLEVAKLKRKATKSFLTLPSSKASAGTARSASEGGGCWSRWFRAKAQPEKPQESLYEELADLGLDDEDLFFDGLAGLDHRDALFACSMLLLALMLDGRVGKSDWSFITRAARSVNPPLEANWSGVVHLMNIYTGGRQMNARLFHDVFENSEDGEAKATCCEFVARGMRNSLNYINCC
mmetsp:Transcript_92831/g.220710  ORF Transcript_92831/g.220710 Transcript_92831/m.220710 type:complete len:211 (+) Transcript_92831:2-634(+)